MRFTLRQLEVFRAVARSESVSDAARALAMSQSAASAALSDLERQFDVALFDRVGRRLRLSELGRAVWPEAEALLSQASELELRLSSIDVVGPLRIGATLTIGNYVGVHLVGEYMRRHPGAEVSLHVANTSEVARGVSQFEIDVGLVEGEVSQPDLELSPWREDELVVFCGPAHPFSRRRQLSDTDLRGADWIVREPGSGTRQAFERAMRGIWHELRLKLELEHTEAIKNAVAAGMGVGCLSKLAVADAVRRGDLVRCAVPHRDFRRRFYFLLHRGKHRSAGVRAWLDLCGESDRVAARARRPRRS